jgi:serine/threonine-protein kinase
VSAQTEIRIGSEFVGYRIDELIGRGGMGVVYRAHDLRLRRTVALKLMAPELALDQRFRERFAREAELAMSLEHPNVVPVHDAGDIDGRLYLAMRYVEGTDLRALLHAEGALDPARALALCNQVANALDAAHANGLVHRDVKPSNVLLDQNEHVYLADFGLTRRLDEQGGPSGEGRFAGTPAYLAPEQIEGGPLDGRTDEYSLGCLLYQCLTGETPFARGSRLAVAWAHLEEEPPSASGRHPGLPEGIDAVLRRAMAKQPADRYPTCAALIAAAEDALGLGRPPPVHRRVLVIGAVVVCALLAAGLAAAWVARGSGHHTAAPPAVRANTLVRIDAVTNKIDAVIGVGRSPFEAAVAGPRVWVYNYAGPSVTEIDAATRAVVQTTTVATSPTESLTSSTGPDLAADQGGAWLIGLDQRGTPYLTRVLAGGGKREYRLKQRPLAVAAGYGFVWVAARGAHHSSLLRIDPATGQITKQTRFPTAAPIDGLTTGLGNVWVNASSNGTLYRVNPHSARRTAGVNLGSHSSRPAVVLGQIWSVLSYGGSSATDIIDPRTVRTVDSVSGDDKSCCATGENGSIWSYDPPTGTVERWDGLTHESLFNISLTHPPSFGGLCLTSITAGAGAVWVTVTPSVNFGC